MLDWTKWFSLGGEVWGVDGEGRGEGGFLMDESREVIFDKLMWSEVIAGCGM